MIEDCKAFLKAELMALGFTENHIYETESDANTFKGGSYAEIIITEDQDIVYNGSKIAKTLDLERGVRIYHTKLYDMKIILRVRFCGIKEDIVKTQRDSFLKNLDSDFADSGNYLVEVVASQGKHIKDASILGKGFMKEVNVLFDGGIYKTKEVPIIKNIQVEGNFSHK